jgi:type VI secretion system secreted protein Hcp
MTIDCHLKLDGVKGEATHKGHKDEISIENWLWSVQNSASTVGGGSGTGKAIPGKLTVRKKFDISSPVIAKNCASGKHFKDATLTMSKAGGSQDDFLVVKLKEVFVTKHDVAVDKGSEVNDIVELSYGDIEFSYKPQKADGSFGGEAKFGWDVRTTETR